MKVITLLAICIFGSAFSVDHDLLEKWQQFKLDHNKEYHSTVESEFRLKIFIDNLAKITKHNKEYEEGKHTYKLSLNRFSDMLHSEFVDIMTSTLPTPPRTGKPAMDKKELETLMSAEVPESIDWREKGAVNPVLDQGLCGCCWAFSALGALESMHHIKTGESVVLSPQNLIDCTADYNCHGCSGGWPQRAYDYIKENGGVNPEQAYPYEQKDRLTCRYDPENVVAKVTGHVVLPENDEKALEKAVGSVGPVSILFNAEMPGFHLYAGGMYSVEECDPQVLTHAMIVIGYGTEDGQDYWLVKNSFGTTWGDKGYMKVAKDKGNMCGVASSMVYPIV